MYFELQNLHPDLQPLLDEKSNDKKLRVQPAHELSKLPLEAQIQTYKRMRKINGATARIDFIKAHNGKPVKRRKQNPERELQSLKSFVAKTGLGVDRFVELHKQDFEAVLGRLKPEEIVDLVKQLRSNSDSLLELAEIMESFSE